VWNRLARFASKEPQLKRVLLIAGARPNFVKIAPLYKRLKTRPGVEVALVHTGQHYDARLSAIFFEQLALPEPTVNLQVGSGSHGVQTGRLIERVEATLLEYQPEVMVVVGDVNSTLGAALAAAKVEYGDGSRPLIAHIEAGLRSGDRRMPEEINRVLTDALSDLLFTTEAGARTNLLREGIADHRIHFVGNIMIDCLIDLWPCIDARREWLRFGLEKGAYGLVTLHRPSNVDAPDVLKHLIAELQRVAERFPIVFAVHPRTRIRLQELGLDGVDGIRAVDSLGYVEFLSLLSGARIVLTDSGGVQEESTFLGVRCLTLRDNTERPVTVTHGTNTLIGSQPDSLASMVLASINEPTASSEPPSLWDGHASERIVTVLETEV